jgi:hypothetical protein
MLIRTRTREGSRTKSLTHRWLRRPVARVLALFVPDLETLGWLSRLVTARTVGRRRRTLAMACVDTASGAVIADSIGRCCADPGPAQFNGTFAFERLPGDRS